jgi:hypothetical protein
VLGSISEWSDISVIQFAYTGFFRSSTLGTIWAKTDMFHLKLLINFISLSIADQIDWHTSGGICKVDWSCVEAKWISSLAPSSRSFQLV